MLAAIGDLVEDIVVHRAGPLWAASDTTARIVRRQGGSAATVCVVAAGLGAGARFIGQVGDDPLGATLCAQLAAAGVDLAVRRAGRTGAIVVLVDPDGERSMLTDVGDARAISDPDPRWLDGVTTLHVPLYAMADEPIRATALTLAAWAHARGACVSVDTSSVAVIESVGRERVIDLLSAVRPHVVFANEPETDTIGRDALAGSDAEVVVVKRGAAGAEVLQRRQPPRSVAAEHVVGVRDTTGAGDAFAAGFLVSRAQGASADAAAAAGHRSAAAQIRRVSA